MPDLITQFQRRIQKYYEEKGILPTISVPGTNHIDNPNDWTENQLYKGEHVINFYDGNLYTSDGKNIIVLNKENAILEGMQVMQPFGAFSGGIPRWLTVSDGYVRINGKVFKHISSTTKIPPSNGDLQVEENNTAISGRYDLIYASSGYPNKHAIGDVNYKANIGVVKGTGSIEDILLNKISIPDESILLAIVWVPPLYTDSSTHQLRPWSWGVHTGSETGVFGNAYLQNIIQAQSYPLRSVSPSELIYLLTMYQFEHIDSVNIEYQRVYLRNQILIDNANIYKVTDTHYCIDSTSSLLSGKFIAIGGSGSPGGGGGTTIHSLLTGLSFDAAHHTGFQRSTFAFARDPEQYDSSYPPAGYEKADFGNFWLNTLTTEVFMCVDDTPSAAVWVTAFGDVKDTINDKNIAALETTTDYDLAMNQQISTTPANESYVKVEVNGLNAIVCDGVITDCDCYFSNDSGITSREIKDIRELDELFWIGSHAGYELATTDEISLFYLVNTGGSTPSGDLTGPLWGGDALTP